MKLQIILTQKEYSLKPGTKTVYVLDHAEKNEISMKNVSNYIDSMKFMRRLGGSETCEYNYTPAGYLPQRIISKNPDRSKKIERLFSYRYID